MGDPLAAFDACQNSQQPRSPSDIVAKQATALASLMKAMGITTCTTVDAGVSTPLIPILAAQVAVSVGCEQLSVMATSIDTTQRVLQCAINSVSQSSSTFVMQKNNITIQLTGHAHIDCLSVSQTINSKIASYADFGAGVQQKFGVTINDMVKSMATNVQDASKTLTTPQGQKAVTQFTQQLDQSANSSTYSQITQEAINDFQASNTFTLKLSEYAFIGAAYPNQTTGCVVIDQNIMMQVLSQNIMNASLSNVFSTDVAAAFTQEWINSQKSVTKGLGLDFSGILGGLVALLLIAALAVGLFMLLKNRGNNPAMSSANGNPGGRGKIIAIVILLLGIVFFILGIVCLATGFSTILGVILLIAGIVMIGLGGYMLWRAMKLQVLGQAVPKI